MILRSLGFTSEPLAQNKPPKGLGIAAGVAIGAAIGAATDNLGLWIALGVAIGAALEANSRKK